MEEMNNDTTPVVGEGNEDAPVTPGMPVEGDEEEKEEAGTEAA